MDRREVLEAAFDELENDTEGTTDEVVEETAEVTDGSGESEQTPTQDKALEDAKGGEKESNEALARTVGAKAKETEQKAKGKDEALSRAAEAAKQTGAVGEVGKAPISWKPAAKEQWAKLPVDIRQEVIRREQEMSRFIS